MKEQNENGVSKVLRWWPVVFFIITIILATGYLKANYSQTRDDVEKLKNIQKVHDEQIAELRTDIAWIKEGIGEIKREIKRR